MAGYFWYRIVRSTVKNLLFRLGLGGLRTVHEERVPLTGPVIVAPVHFSYLDPPVVSCGMRRRITFMAKEELFRHRVFGSLIRSLGAFPVKRGEGDTEAIRLTMRLLEEGNAVLMFPEGTRGDAVTLGPISRGVGMIAKRTGASIVPIGINGTQIALPKTAKKLRRYATTLVFGEPFTYAEVTQGLSEREGRERFVEVLTERLISATKEAGLELKTSSNSSDSSADARPSAASETLLPAPDGTQTPH